MKNPLDLEDLGNKYDELVRTTVDTFNRTLKENGVDTDLYRLEYQDCFNEKIFGADFLNCTIQGILTQSCNDDLLAKLLKIAGRVCKTVEREDLKLVKIIGVAHYDNYQWFNLLFEGDRCVHAISLTVRNYDSLSFDPDKDIYMNSDIRSSFSVEEIISLHGGDIRISNSPHSDIHESENGSEHHLSYINVSNSLNSFPLGKNKKFIPSILPSGITNGEIGPITSTFTSGGEFNYNDVKAYNKIALAMKTNRENLEDKFKSIINMGILG